MKKKIYSFLFTVLLMAMLCSHSNANSDCSAPSASVNLDVNNVRAKLLNGGDMFWDIFGARGAVYEIPKNSGRHASFTSSLFFSGVDAGNNLYTAGQTYRQTGLDFWPGALDDKGEISKMDCDDWNEMFNVYGAEINNVKSAKSISYNISRWKSSHAPFYDANADGIYDPSLGDYPVYDLNKPDVVPAQMVFWVFNDMGGPHTAYATNNRLGIEIQATAVAYVSSSSEVMNNSTIYRYKIINKSVNSYAQFRMGMFNDFDLGNAADDYVGCDLSTNAEGAKRNLFYVYNADDFDEDAGSRGYGQAPPAFGLTFLNTSKNANGDDLGVHSFFSIANTGMPGTNQDPRTPEELNRYLSGLWADGKPITYGTPSGTGGNDPCFFMFPGNTDPDGRPNWVETKVSGNRRTIVSLKDKPLAPGEQMTVELAYVWARDTFGNHLSSLEKLRRSTDTLISAYKTNFSNFSTGIKQQIQKQIKVYPNPSNHFIVIEGIDNIHQIKIYNTQGKVVRIINKPLSTKIDIRDLPEGAYYIRVDGYSAKFMKME